MLLHQATRPGPRKQIFQRFGLSCSFKWVSHDRFNYLERFDSGHPIGFNPVYQVFTKFRMETASLGNFFATTTALSTQGPSPDAIYPSSGISTAWRSLFSVWSVATARFLANSADERSPESFQASTSPPKQHLPTPAS